MADCRLREKKPLGCAGDVALGHDGIEHDQQVQIDSGEIHGVHSIYCDNSVPPSGFRDQYSFRGAIVVPPVKTDTKTLEQIMNVKFLIAVVSAALLLPTLSFAAAGIDDSQSQPTKTKSAKASSDRSGGVQERFLNQSNAPGGVGG